MKKQIMINVILVSLGIVLTACAQLSVTGLIQGEIAGQPITVTRQQINRGQVDTVNRVQKFQGQPFTESVDDPAIQLSVGERNNPPAFNETYYYLGITSPKDEISGGTADDLNYVPNNIGKMSYLTINQDEGQVEAAPQLGEAHVGASWLARVEQNDRTIPYLISSGSSNCFPLGGGDCFDVESLSRLLFVSLTEPVEDNVRASIPFVQNVHHRLHFVPQVSHPGIGPNNRPAKGFGFIYYAQISVPGANFQIYVPINFLLLRDVDQYILAIDPLALDPDDQQTIDQIYVKENLLGGIDVSITEQLIRQQVVNAIGNASLPELIPGIDFSEAIIAAMNGAAGNPNQIPTNYDVLLTPTGNNRDLSNTVLWEQPLPGSVLPANQAALFFLE